MTEFQSNLSVSIVLATYNGEKFLHEQLDSVFAQTFPILEVIAVDDCSSDSTVSILNEYAMRHPILKIYHNEKNLKHNQTFERGILLATGDCIAMCDQDDIWDKDKILIMMESWKSDSYLIHCDSEFIDDQGNRLNKKISDIKNLQTYTDPVPFIIGNTVAGHASIFRKDLAKIALPFPSIIIHDWWLAFAASTLGPVQYIDRPLVQYRQHADSVIGAIKLKRNKIKKKRKDLRSEIRKRIYLFYKICPDKNIAKNVLLKLNVNYSDFSISNNLSRMITFFQYRKLLLATKKRTLLRQWLFCVKMYFSLI